MGILDKLGGKARKVTGEVASGPDKLTKADLLAGRQILRAQSGVPACADGVAYEPVQRLLAISSADGRVKLYGREGVERTLETTSNRTPTRQLLFVPNQGLILRLSVAGVLEAWSIEGSGTCEPQKPLCSMKLQNEHICCMSLVMREPFVMLGCTDGTVRIAALTNGSGSVASDGRPAKGLRLVPHKVTQSDLLSDGPTTNMEVQSCFGQHLLLAVHQYSGASFWHLRGQYLITQIRKRDPAGAITAACWVPLPPVHVATGHSSGTILLWQMPRKPAADPVLLSALQLCSNPAAPVRSLSYLSGKRESLLVQGGQASDLPEKLAIAGLPKQQGPQVGEDGEEPKAATEGLAEHPGSVTILPWFGGLVSFTVVASPGSISGYEFPSAVIMLLEQAEVVVYGLESDERYLVKTHLQALGDVTASCLSNVPVGRMPVQGLQAASMTALRAWAVAVRRDGKDLGLAGRAWPPELKGGELPRPRLDASVATLYTTGHASGLTRFWELHGEAPTYLGAAPSSAAASFLSSQEQELRPVSAICFNWEHSLLVVGHDAGMVCCYQFSNVARSSSSCAVFKGFTVSEQRMLSLSEPAGFQLRVSMTGIHNHEITALAYTATCRQVALGDRSGAVSVIEMARPALLWYQVPNTTCGITSMTWSLVPMPPASARNEDIASRYANVQTNEPVWCVLLLTADANIGTLDARFGFLLGRSGLAVPKNVQTALYLDALDADGQPTWMARDLHTFIRAGMAQEQAQQVPHVYSPEPQLDDAEDNNEEVLDDEQYQDEDEDDEEVEDDDVDALLAAAAAKVQDRERMGVPAGKGGRRAAVVLNRAGNLRRADAPEPKEDVSNASSRLTRLTKKLQPRPSEGPSTSGQAAKEVASKEESPAAYVLVITEDCLRLYPMYHVIIGDRHTTKKVVLHGTMVFASTFQVNGHPGLVVVVRHMTVSSVAVYSLPNLELTRETPLSEITGWGFTWDQRQELRLSRVTASTRDGELVLLGPNTEVYRLAMAVGATDPRAAVNMFDWELAAAASAAALAQEQAQVQRAQDRAASGALQSGVASVPAPVSPSSEDVSSQADRSVHERQRTGFFSRIQLDLTKGLQETTKRFVQVFDEDIPSLLMGGGTPPGRDGALNPYGSARAGQPMPDLHSVFALGPVEGDLDLSHRNSSTSVEEEEGYSPVSTTSTAVSAAPAAPRMPTQGGGVVRPSYTGDVGGVRPAAPSSRVDAGRPASSWSGQGPAPATRMRTAQEIKAAYGHATGSTPARASELSNIMSENMQRLGERGEKLSLLNEKTAALEESAQSFAEMAKKLAEQQKKKGWWG